MFAPIAPEISCGRNEKLLILCDHASYHIPDDFSQLGLGRELIEDHMGWDIGAKDLSLAVSAHFEANTIAATVSRLVIDCNRAPDAHDLIPIRSGGHDIIGNLNLTDTHREGRIEAYHAPFHQAVESHLAETRPELVVAIHSFTPSLMGQDRPWHIGFLFDQDHDMAHRLARATKSVAPDWVIGMNEPYAASEGVFYTLDRHAQKRQIPHTLIEIRNDLLRSPDAISAVSARLSAILETVISA